MGKDPNKKEHKRECIGCGDELEADHPGIICANDHHICSTGECSKNFVKHTLGQGVSGIPVKCMNCHCEVISNTFERQLDPTQLRAYQELCIKVSNSENEGEVIKTCPFCPDMVILVLSPGDCMYFCNNPECNKTSCLVCRKICDTDDKKITHITRCGRVGALRDEVIDIINLGSQGTCPNVQCNFSAMKDEACTHIICTKCRLKWCYVCGLPEAKWDGGSHSHNSEWQTNKKRCPMYLDFIHQVNGTWPSDPDEVLAHFHERKILKLLKDKFDSVDRQEIKDLLETFPECIAPFTLEMISKATPVRNF